MRRFLSILLLAVCGLPLATPLLFAADAEAGIPVCCRRAGAHHCQMRMHSTVPTGTPALHTPPVPCPFRGDATYHAPAPVAAGPDIRSASLIVASHPAGVAQTESRWRTARERSRGKRGPPQHLG